MNMDISAETLIRNPLLTALKAKIDAAQAVSFDFFDTLFVRPLVSPEDAFDLLGARFNIANFRQLRRQAQTLAFQRMHEQGRKEITLAGIYDCLPAQAVPTATLMQAEYDLELALVFPNSELVALFKELVTSGKPVVLTSDMYFSAAFFEAALARFDLPTIPVFSSADCNATKRDSGEIFLQVAEHLQLPPEQILHIGDNERADVIQPKARGLKTFFYQEQRPPLLSKAHSPEASLAAGLQRDYKEHFAPDSFAELGFAYGGPAAVGFLDWLVEQAQQDKIERVLFLSRDGYVLQQLAEQLPAGSLPEFEYFKGSRIAFYMSAITDANFAHFIPFMLSGAEGLTPAELLLRLGVTPPSDTVLANIGLGSEVRVSQSIMSKLSQFLWAWRFTILQVCCENRRALYQYLHDLGIGPGTKVALVDVGWSGTTQDSFEQAMAQLFELEVVGYYFCLANTLERQEREQRNSMKALIGSPTISHKKVNQVYDNRVAAELFFSAPHQTVIGFTTNAQGKLEAREDTRLPADLMVEENNELARGIMLFAKAYQDWCARLQFVPQPLGTVEPLVTFMTETPWQDHPCLAELHNFDGWSYTVNKNAMLGEY